MIDTEIANFQLLHSPIFKNQIMGHPRIVKSSSNP